MSKSAYFTFGRDNTENFQKKNCTVLVDLATKTLAIQTLDKDSPSTSVSFRCHFFQLQKHLYAFDLIFNNDVVIAFPTRVMCSKFLGIVTKDKPVINKNDLRKLFKTRFLPSFVRQYVNVGSTNSIREDLFNEIISAFTVKELDLFSEFEKRHFPISVPTKQEEEEQTTVVNL